MIAGAGKERDTMARFTHTAALLTMSLALAGCGTGAALVGSDDPAFNSNRGVYSENQPIVEHSSFAFDVSTSGDSIPGGEAARLRDWFDSLQLRYGDVISLDTPSGGRGVRADVAHVAAEYGLLLSDDSPVVPGNVQPGSARVIVTRSTASVPGCPNWRQAKLSGAPVSTESNYGCAMNSNLAAMIANPNDLVLGQEGAAGSDPATAAKAVRTYRENVPTGKGGLKDVSTTGGN
jgi:pilus assembly protein CpaD